MVGDFLPSIAFQAGKYPTWRAWRYPPTFPDSTSHPDEQHFSGHRFLHQPVCADAPISQHEKMGVFSAFHHLVFSSELLFPFVFTMA